MTYSIGAVFVSTGGDKVIRAARSFRRVEPSLPLYAQFDVSTSSWQSTDGLSGAALHRMGIPVQSIGPHSGYVNGAFNAAMRWMASEGHTHALLLHDDIVFAPPSPLGNGPLSIWMTDELLDPATSSGIAYAHLEAFPTHPTNGERYARRPPAEWDALDLESPSLWDGMLKFQRTGNVPTYPPGADFFVQYEGADIPRKWNRLGPTAQVIPIQRWRDVGEFDEVHGVQYDEDYPGEIFRQGLPPVWAVPNLPHLHLHNQSMRPGGDLAPEPWGRDSAHQSKFGTSRVGLWRDDWEARWQGELAK